MTHIGGYAGSAYLQGHFYFLTLLICNALYAQIKLHNMNTAPNKKEAPAK